MPNKKSHQPVWEPLINTIGELRCQNYRYHGKEDSRKPFVYVYQHLKSLRYICLDADSELYFFCEEEEEFHHMAPEQATGVLTEFRQFDADLLH
jgi:L-rhamnose mutarotase